MPRLFAVLVAVVLLIAFFVVAWPLLLAAYKIGLALVFTALVVVLLFGLVSWGWGRFG